MKQELVHLECCVCGKYAGKFQQWWNRDDEYGICGGCAKEQSERLSPEEMKSCYGVEGVNYPSLGGAK